MPTGLTGVTGRSLGVQEPNDRHCRRAAVPRPRAPDLLGVLSDSAKV
jgi:hypothetical protein